MGQQIFIPNNGGGGSSSSDAVFLTGLFNEDGAGYVDYGGDGSVFYTDGFNYCAFIAFRVMRENNSGVPLSLLTVVDGAGNGWRFFISSDNKVCALVDAVEFVPITCDIPLGRVFIAAIDVEVNGGEFYLHGRRMATQGLPDTVPAGPNVAITLGSDDGGESTWNKDYVEYIGFGFINRFLEIDEVAIVTLASQDAERIVFPASIFPDSTPNVIYNAVSGLSNLALWTPSQNTLGAPDLPAIPSGVPTGTLLSAPFHVAHSGWAGLVPVP
jgi:hypothetical protein